MCGDYDGGLGYLSSGDVGVPVVMERVVIGKEDGSLCYSGCHGGSGRGRGSGKKMVIDNDG